jgi:hypothetical protein
MPEKKPKPYVPANPLIWGAVLAIIAALIVFGSDAVGSFRPDNTLLATPAKAAGAGFGFGFLIASFRNWFNERRRSP